MRTPQATTFVALLDPILPSSPPRPLNVMTHSGAEPALHGWAGFGTLAMPGFQRASWDTGWLVQMQDDEDGHRFAFVWGSRQSQPANVLTRLVAQNNVYFVGDNARLRPFRPPT